MGLKTENQKKDNNNTTTSAVVEYCEADVLNVEVSMADKLEIASSVATQLKDILEKQNLAISLNKKDKDAKYVTAEGWNVLGSILGTFARTEEVTPVDFTKARTAYKAKVSIMKGDQVLATAEAIATSTGFQKEEHQIYSMAQTRAMGKAYRMAFSWIMKLAGYEPTPAEEIIEQIREERKSKAKSKNVFSPEQRAKLKPKTTASAIDVEAKDIEVL